MSKVYKKVSLYHLLIFIGLIGLFALTACAGLPGMPGMQIKVGEGSREILAEEAGFELAVFLEKHKPETVPVLRDFSAAMEAATANTAPDVSELLKSYIAEQCADDPVGQARMKRLLRLIEVDISTSGDGEEKLSEMVRYLRAAGKGIGQALDIMAQ